MYVQTSQSTTCFGLFQLGHLQVGHKGQRNYTIMQNYHKSQGGRDLVYKIWGMCADQSAHMPSDLYVQPADGLTGRGRNM